MAPRGFVTLSTRPARCRRPPATGNSLRGALTGRRGRHSNGVGASLPDSYDQYSERIAITWRRSRATSTRLATQHLPLAVRWPHATSTPERSNHVAILLQYHCCTCVPVAAILHAVLRMYCAASSTCIAACLRLFCDPHAVVMRTTCVCCRACMLRCYRGYSACCIAVGRQYVGMVLAYSRARRARMPPCRCRLSPTVAAGTRSPPHVMALSVRSTCAR